MLDNKFFGLFVTFIWMGGLFAIVLTLTYMLQEHRKQGRNSRAPFHVARLLAPLYGSLATFCMGLALQAYAAQQSVSLWVAIVWGTLALLFALRLAGMAGICVRGGWHAALNARRFDDDSANISRQRARFPLRTSLSLILLLVNVLILAWWGSAQINAGVLVLPLAERTSGASKPGVPLATADLAQQAAQRQEASQDQLRSLESNPTSAATATGTAIQQTVAVTDVEILVSPSLEDVEDEGITTTNPSESRASVGTVISPTATTLLILIPTPTPRPADELSVTVRNSSGANVRKAPNLTAEVLSVLADGTVAPVLGRTADGEWYSIQLTAEITGWISIQVIGLEVEAEAIPVIMVN